MSKSAKIAALNDALRRTFTGGRIFKTDGVDALDDDVQGKILEAVRTFADFTIDNDPYGEHDFGVFEIDSRRCFWKIDYFDCRDPDLGAEDPADSANTERVLTIMLAEEY